MNRRFGGDQPADFILLAVDGLQARLDGFQTSLEALRRTAEAMLDSHQPQNTRKPPRQVLALPEAIVVDAKPKSKRSGGSWGSMTPAERSVEMKRRMAVSHAKRKATRLRKKLQSLWTPERRAAAAIEAKRRWKAGVYATKTKT